METQIIEMFAPYGLPTILLAIGAKVFWGYIQKIDKKQEQREIQQRQDYKEMEDRFVKREEKYIAIINKFGTKLEYIESHLCEIKEVIKNDSSNNKKTN